MTNQDYRDANRAGRWAVKWWLLIVAIILILSAIIWGITVATSGVKGQGDAVIKKNSAENWTAAQARFEDLYAEIKAADDKIDVAQDALALDPEDKTLQTNLSGTTNYCISVVADYNADARKYLAADFKAADLPDQIDEFDTDTDCKGTTK